MAGLQAAILPRYVSHWSLSLSLSLSLSPFLSLSFSLSPSLTLSLSLPPSLSLFRYYALISCGKIESPYLLNGLVMTYRDVMGCLLIPTLDRFPVAQVSLARAARSTRFLNAFLFHP